MEDTLDVSEAAGEPTERAQFLYIEPFLFFRAYRIQAEVAWPGLNRAQGLPIISWAGGLGRREGAFLRLPFIACGGG